MKRFSLREVLLLTAPIPIIALGFWGARFREENWPTQPRIVECRVRPATPLEISQGANVGVTVRAIIPNTPEMTKANPYLTYSLRSQGKDDTESIEKMSVRTEVNTVCKSGKYELIYSLAYNLKRDKKQFPLIVTTKLPNIASDIVPVTRQFEISYNDVVLPNVAQARIANFRIASATLFTAPIKGGTTGDRIKLDVVNASRDFPNTTPNVGCVGKWILQDSSNRSLSPSTSIQQENEQQTAKVMIYLDSSKWSTLPRPGAEIRGQLSINRGWPQVIVFEWPKKSAANSAWTEMKFSTKLAPLPK